MLEMSVLQICNSFLNMIALPRRSEFTLVVLIYTSIQLLMVSPALHLLRALWTMSYQALGEQESL